MASKRWLEISLKVNGELAEAVAEVFDRFVVNGVVIEREISQDTLPNETSSGDLVKVFGYLAVDEKMEEIRSQVEQALWYLGRITPLPSAAFHRR